MAAVLRLARERAWMPFLPAAVSWAVLFGYQWAFYFAYHGHQRTVFQYYSGVFGDGLLLPAVNVMGFAIMRQLAPGIPWKRLPVYALLAIATATAVYTTQANLNLVNWSMPIPFRWSDIGQFHFFVLSAELTYLYLVFATAINSWSALQRDLLAWRSFGIGLAGVVLFGVSLAADYVR
ncbi:MAG TPA: hypothetical protein VGG90_09600 [Candidatus Dormibacteraeota bacterium]